jgi:hypothetical protein
VLRQGTESATHGGQRSSGRGGEAATRRGRERDCSGEGQATCVGRLSTRVSMHHHRVVASQTRDRFFCILAIFRKKIHV